MTNMPREDDGYLFLNVNFLDASGRERPPYDLSYHCQMSFDGGMTWTDGITNETEILGSKLPAIKLGSTLMLRGVSVPAGCVITGVD